MTGRRQSFLQEFAAQDIEVNILDNLEDSLGAHAGFKDLSPPLLELVVLILGKQFPDEKVFQSVCLGGKVLIKFCFFLNEVPPCLVDFLYRRLFLLHPGYFGFQGALAVRSFL